jgi:hypothetical protein
MCTHKRASLPTTASWNPHGFSERSRVKPLNPPAHSAVGAFAVNVEAIITRMWHEGNEYMLKLEDDTGNEYSGSFFARDFQPA